MMMKPLSCINSSLDLFQQPTIDNSVELSEEVETLTVSGALNDSSLEFVLTADTNTYIDLGRSYLFLQLKVTKADGQDITESVKLVPLFPHAIFSQVLLYLNGVQISENSSHYGYRAFITALLSYPKSVKDEQLTVLSHWGGKTLSSASESEVDAYTPLFLDLAHQCKLILSGVEIKIHFTRQNDKFSIIRTKSGDQENYRIHIMKASLFVAKVIPSSSILLSHAKQLSTGNVTYFYEKTWVKAFNLSKGIHEITLPNIFQGPLPVVIIIGLVKGANFHGDYEQNPFQFNHYNLSSIHLTVNSKQIPTKSIEVDFERKLCARAYHSLFETALNNSYDSYGLGISLDSYIKEYPLYGFNVQPVLACASNECLMPPQTGNVNVCVAFKKELPDTVTMIVLGEFQSSFQIDAARNIYAVS